MPKELIYGPRGASAGTTEPRLSVQWSRDREVQIGTIAPEDARLSPTPEGNGWFLTLDRAGINKTIRALRRARDQAFGRDE